MKKRIEYIDIAKGLALLLVMLFHVKLDMVSGDELHDWFMVVFGPCVVSVFFFLSGMCFKFNTDPKQFLLGKVKTLLIPYFSFGLIIVIAFWIVDDRSLNSFLRWLAELFIQKRYATLWFLATLFVGVIIFWGICCLANDDLNKVMLYSVLTSGVGFAYSYLVGTPLIWNTDLALCVQVFFAGGYFLKRKNLLFKIQDMKKSSKWLLCFSCFAIEIAFAMLNRILGFADYQMFYSRFGCLPLTLTAAFAGCFGIIFFASAVSLQGLNFLGKNSLTYFALHQTLFIESAYIIYSILGINYLSTENYTYLFCRTATMIYCLVGCTLLHFLFKNTKLRFMLGK